MKPIIGIVGRSDLSTKNKSTICVFDNYRKAVLHYGGIPIVILPPQTIDYHEMTPKDSGSLTKEEKMILERQINLCDGIVMPGGNRRYEYDIYICNYCNKKQIPLLGICMGMQIMCTYDNDNQNIKNKDNSHHSEQEYKHIVTVDKDSKLFNILKETEILVNSFHNYHVANSGNYNAVAHCEDIIEAVEKKEDLFNIGVQWHPEKTFQKDINSQRLFTEFINCANTFHENKKV